MTSKDLRVLASVLGLMGSAAGTPARSGERLTHRLRHPCRLSAAGDVQSVARDESAVRDHADDSQPMAYLLRPGHTDAAGGSARQPLACQLGTAPAHPLRSWLNRLQPALAPQSSPR